MTVRAQILDAAKQAVTVDRAATHGDAEQTFGLIAAYWSAHLDHPVSATDAATMLALLKLARARGNPAHQDNWIDCAGYAACAGELSAPPVRTTVHCDDAPVSVTRDFTHDEVAAMLRNAESRS